jgi:hypothetical protein
VRRNSTPSPFPKALFWTVVSVLASAAVVVACVAPVYRGGDVPRAASSIHKALRSGYENARRSQGPQGEPLADIRGGVA